MTNEEAIKFINGFKKCFERMESNGVLGKWGEYYAACDLAISALQSAGKDIIVPTKDDHFREVTKMIPLTIEDLRKMDGQPVWIECLEDKSRSGWRLIFWDRGKYLVLLHTSLYGFLMDDYGNTWIAYTYPPAHIGREAWKPCADCKSCVSCEYSMVPYGEKPCTVCRKKNRFKPRKFCNSCGKPLTEEAWAELEKRLRG